MQKSKIQQQKESSVNRKRRRWKVDRVLAWYLPGLSSVSSNQFHEENEHTHGGLEPTAQDVARGDY